MLWTVPGSLTVYTPDTELRATWEEQVVAHLDQLDAQVFSLYKLLEAVHQQVNALAEFVGLAPERLPPLEQEHQMSPKIPHEDDPDFIGPKQPKPEQPDPPKPPEPEEDTEEEEESHPEQV